MDIFVGCLNVFYFCKNKSSFFKRFYLFLGREEGKEKERERNINVWLPLADPTTGDVACNPGTGPDRIEPVTFWFAGLRSIH